METPSLSTLLGIRVNKKEKNQLKKLMLTRCAELWGRGALRDGLRRRTRAAGFTEKAALPVI